MTKNQILAQAKRLGLCYDITSPGDGVSRYNFYTPGPKAHTFGRTLAYCRGKSEAESFLRGYEEATIASEIDRNCPHCEGACRIDT